MRNHNDTGSLTVYKNGQPLLIDIGVESYSRKTFSPQRYEIWTMQSAYHNLPTIGGIMQQDGSDFAASDIYTETDEDHALISMDIAGAYPAEAGLRSYIRQIRLNRNAAISEAVSSTAPIELHDEIAFEGGVGLCKPVVLSFITYEEPSVSSDNTSISIGGLGRMKLAGTGAVTIERLPVTDARLMTAWDHDLYRIRMKMTDKKFRIG